MFFIFSCDKNPFGYRFTLIEGTQMISLNQGFRFSIPSEIVIDDWQADFFFYSDSETGFKLGLGFDSEANISVDTIYDYNLPHRFFDSIRFAPPSSAHVSEVGVSFESNASAIFSIYTREGRFAKIVVRELIVNADETNMIFDYIYNPRSHNSYNRSFYLDN